MAAGYLFAYGTLMSGFGNHERYLGGRVLKIERATVEGELYHLRYGYPALVPGAGRVAGELILVKDLEALLPQLDALEDYFGPGEDNMYERVEVEALTESGEKIRAYTYRYARLKELEKKGLRVKGGDWRRFLMLPGGRRPYP
ncbi:MAG: gamma-glutamylcyclotransferase [Peptococcaceae bacterium]|nr:gamma-glutamylcyclotransferase [Peptococcaceae bacterium]